MKTIVVPVDGSEHANRAAQFAAKLASDASAALTLVHVYEPPTASLMGLEAKSREEIEQTMRQLAQASFDAALEVIGTTEVPTTTRVLLGHPARQIVEFADASGADLLVMGARGRSELGKLMLGSVSEHVMRRATCPVTIVR